MFYRTFVGSCVLFLSVRFAACYSTDRLPRSDLIPGTEYNIVEVVNTNGDRLVMKDGSGRIGAPKDSCVVGVLEDGKLVRIPLSEVQSVQVSSTNTTVIVLTILGVALAALLAMGATSSWD